MEKTLIILKPDAVDRRLVGAILSRFERKGLQIVAMKMAVIAPETAAKHYADHQGKHFYPALVEFMTGGPVVLVVLAGDNAISVARKMMGKTAGFEAEPGTIRGDFGMSGQFNLIHGSDSPEAADKEIQLFFTPADVQEFTHSDARWVETPDD